MYRDAWIQAAGYALAATVGWWLPFITIGLLALAIVIARRRSTAILGTGIGLAVGGATLAVSLGVGGAAMGVVAGNLELSPSALDVIHGQLVDAMRRTSIVIAVLGVFVAALGWIMGGSRAADSVRGTVRRTNAAARTRLATRGLDTGGFGSWLGRYRVLVRSLIAVAAVRWMFLLRPLTFGDIVLVIAVAVAVAWALELLQRRPEEHPAALAAEENETDAATTKAAASDTFPLERRT